MGKAGKWWFNIFFFFPMSYAVNQLQATEASDSFSNHSSKNVRSLLLLALTIDLHSLVHDISQWKRCMLRKEIKKKKIKKKKRTTKIINSIKRRWKNCGKVTGEKRGCETKPHTNCNYAYFASRKLLWSQPHTNRVTRERYIWQHREKYSSHAPICSSADMIGPNSNLHTYIHFRWKKDSEGLKNEMYLTVIFLTCSSISFARSSCSSIFKIACLISSLDSFSLSTVSTLYH